MKNSKLKKVIRDSVIALLSLSGASAIYRWRVRRKGPLVRVLCFHDVTDREWFANMLDALTKQYHILTPTQFRAGEFHKEKINLLFTFDDGYQSWVDVVLPEFQRRDINGVFFISSGLLDAAATGEEAAANFVRRRLRLSRSRVALTWDGARELVAAGQTIGGHTRTHARLSQLIEEEVEREVTEDKVRLEHKLAIYLTDFAYPFGRTGDISTEAEAVVAAAGYLHQYSAETGWFAMAPLEKPISRTLIEDGQSIASIHRWIGGGYDVLNKFKI